VSPEDHVPSEAEREYVKGSAFLHSGRYREALSCFHRATTLAPESAPAHFAAGSASLALEEWSRAEGYFSRAAQLDPGDYKAQLGWGTSLAPQEKFEQALWKFDRAQELAPDALEPLLDAGHALGSFAMRTGDRGKQRQGFREAEKRFEAATEKDSASAEAWQGLGEARGGQGDYTGALEAFGEAVAIEGAPLAAHIGLGQMANNLEEYATAKEALERVVPLTDDAARSNLVAAVDARAALVTAFSGLRRTADALEVAVGLLVLLGDPAFAGNQYCGQAQTIACVQASGLLAQLGEYEEAIDFAEAVVASGEEATTPYGLLMLAAIHAARGDYDEMATTLSRAEDLYPDVPPGASTISIRLQVEALLARDRIEDAYEFMARACLTQPDELELHMAFVQLIAREGQRSAATERIKWRRRLNQAVADARRVLALRQDRPSAKLTDGTLDVLGGEAEAARKKLLEAVESDPLSYEAQGLLGMAYGELGKDEKAARCFRAALRLMPGEIAYTLALARTYARLQNLEGAEELYGEVIEQAPANVEALAGLGAVLARRDGEGVENYIKARGHLEMALRMADTMNADLIDQKASLRLSASERAGIQFQMGYAYCRQYECEAQATPARQRPALMRSAAKAFARAFEEDPSMHRAERAREKVEHEREALAAEKPPLWLLVAIGVLLLGLASAFFAHAPYLAELNGPTYSGMTLGLLVVLIAALYLPRLRSLSVAGVSMEKDVDAVAIVANLGVESDPDFIRRIPLNLALGQAPGPAGSRAGSESSNPARAGSTAMGEDASKPASASASAGYQAQRRPPEP
jgi:tetratricopeptide (TPR) repeat protein